MKKNILSIVLPLLMAAIYSTETYAQVSDSSSERIYTVVNQEAEYPGGVSALLADFSENFKYSQEAREKEIGGKLSIIFVVECDGSISHVQCVKSLGHGLDKAAIRAVKSLKNFSKPALENGEPVRSYYSLPVSCGLK